MVALVLRYRSESRRAALDAYNALRVELIGDVFTGIDPTAPDTADVETLQTSLRYLGPARLDKLTRQAATAGIGLSERRVLRDLGPGLAAITEKHTVDAGRDATFEAIVRDDAALGYARITRPNACGFCAMLASRGFVYAADTVIKTKAGDAYHAGCRCVPAPQFDADQELPKLNRDFSDLWAESTRGLSGNHALSAFRVAVGETQGAAA